MTMKLHMLILHHNKEDNSAKGNIQTVDDLE
jgi:hypothetical protein